MGKRLLRFDFLLLWFGSLLFTQFGYRFLHHLKFTFGYDPESGVFWMTGYVTSTILGLILILYPAFRLVKSKPQGFTKVPGGNLSKSILFGVLYASGFYVAAETISWLFSGRAPNQLVAMVFFCLVYFAVSLAWAMLVALPLLLWRARDTLTRAFLVQTAGFAAIALLAFSNIDFTTSETTGSSFGRSLGTISVNGSLTPLGWLTTVVFGWGVFGFGLIAGIFAADRLGHYEASGMSLEGQRLA